MTDRLFTFVVVYSAAESIHGLRNMRDVLRLHSNVLSKG